MISNLENHLKEACEITGAMWGGFYCRLRESGWFIAAAHGRRPKSKQNLFTKYLGRDEIGKWLEDALHEEDINFIALLKTSIWTLHVYTPFP